MNCTTIQFTSKYLLHQPTRSCFTHTAVGWRHLVLTVESRDRALWLARPAHTDTCMYRSTCTPVREANIPYMYLLNNKKHIDLFIIISSGSDPDKCQVHFDMPSFEVNIGPKTGIQLMVQEKKDMILIMLSGSAPTSIRSSSCEQIYL